jgi:multidrug efflux pump subunit AcrA (membrane-fusion protein)
VLATAALPVAGCTEVETESATGYEPSTLEPVKGNKDIQRVTFTAEGAKRVDLQTAPVRRNVVPYAALIYDPEGKTYVYTSPKPLEYLREEVKVDRIEGDRVLVSRGPPTGTEVVTVGAAEVYGTELEVPSH